MEPEYVETCVVVTNDIKCYCREYTESKAVAEGEPFSPCRSCGHIKGAHPSNKGKQTMHSGSASSTAVESAIAKIVRTNNLRIQTTEDAAREEVNNKFRDRRHTSRPGNVKSTSKKVKAHV
jgi:hypothetical protein